MGVGGPAGTAGGGAEKDLRKSEARHRAVVETATDAIVTMTASGLIQSFNPAAERIFGYPEEEVVGRPLRVLMPERFRGPHESAFRRYLAGGEARVVGKGPVEFAGLRKDGREFPLELSLGETREEDDVLFVGVIRDITGRKRAERQLRETSEFQRAIVEQSVECIYLFDPETKRVLEANAAFADLLGYSAEELPETTLYDFVAHEREDVDLNVERHVLQERRFVGERTYRKKDGTTFDVEASATVIPYYGGEAVCCVVRDVTERKALEGQLRRRSLHDALTGLPNRALFLEHLQNALARARREGATAAVLFVDLDDFKVVNDSLGHEGGDALLAAVAERLRGCVRPGDTVARLFGDEFAVVLEPPADVDAAKEVAERLQERLRLPIDVDGREVFASCCVGIAVEEPGPGGGGSGTGPRDALRRADLAMYAAKGRGKDSYEVYDPGMNARALRRMELENDLRRAVEREEFEVHYQPIIDLGTHQTVALEALARWRHPERGHVDPGEFVDLAEETGLIRPLGRLVLEDACRRAKGWRGRHPGRGLRVSVNFSASQFERQAGSIPGVLEGAGLDPRALQLEITERAVMEDAEAATEELRRLKELGVGFAIDDYGTGYSCLYYLKRMPVDLLKVDRSFVAGLGQDPDDTAIVSGTIDLAHALGLRVVAEGVETTEQLERLREMGCDLAQGFLFSEPLPAEEVPGFLDRG